VGVAYQTLGYQETPVRVQFGQVDRYGTLWHGHVAAFLELARADLARPFGLGAPDLLKVDLAVPMLEIDCQYRAPAFDDEALVVQCTLLKPELPLPELVFLYRIVRHSNRDEIARARTRQLFVRPDGRLIVRVPREIRQRMDDVWAHLSQQPAWLD
jgi:acyl-CoA thioester hydrolase